MQEISIIERQLEIMRQDMETTRQILEDLPMRRDAAMSDPIGFIHSLQTNTAPVPGFHPSQGLITISREKYQDSVHDIGQSFAQAFPQRSEFARRKPAKRMPLENKRLNLADIKSRLAAYSPYYGKLRIKIPTSSAGDSGTDSPMQSPSMVSSPINVLSTLAPTSQQSVGSPAATSRLKPRVHFTKTRVSGGFYMAQAGLSSPYMIPLEDKNLKKRTKKRSDITIQLDQLSTLPLEQKLSKEYGDLMKLLRQKFARQIAKYQNISTAIHAGYRCDGCSHEPITGTRWNCIDCPQGEAIDLCDNCYWSRHLLNVTADSHIETHRFRDVLAADSYWEAEGIYNYLDPSLEDESAEEYD
eukprot:Partr_v1_DN26195_c1_g1_i3_m10631 putative zinc finger, ZZ-type containing 3